jgi:hypothetical protein
MPVRAPAKSKDLHLGRQPSETTRVPRLRSALVFAAKVGNPQYKEIESPKVSAGTCTIQRVASLFLHRLIRKGL